MVREINMDILNVSKNAYTLFLPDIRELNILYITHDIRDSTLMLADSCKKLTLLYFNEDVQCERNSDRAITNDSSNITIIKAQKGSTHLPFKNASFDAVILDNTVNHSDSNKINLKYFLASIFKNEKKIITTRERIFTEIERVIKSSGWCFIITNNKFSRHIKLGVTMKLKSICNNNIFFYKKSIHQLSKLLKINDFKIKAYYAFDNRSKSLNRIIDLESDIQIKKFKSDIKGKIKKIPLFIYRYTVPSFGVLAFKSRMPAIWIDKVIDKIIIKIECTDCTREIESIEINSKGKIVITIILESIEITRRMVIKIPLSPQSSSHILHSFNGLSYIREISQDTFFPEPIMRDEQDGLNYTVESFCSGNPWIYDSNLTHANKIIDQIIDSFLILRNIEAINTKNYITLYKRLCSIRQFIKLHNPLLFDKSKNIFDEFEGMEDHDKKQYFYKSDFSVSNLLIDADNIKGIIDLDFWGTSSNKIIDFADLIMSYSRNFYNMSIETCLINLYIKNIDIFPEELNIKDNIIKLESSVNELSEAAIISWINSTFHILDFDSKKYNMKIMRKQLINPLNGLLRIKD